jgi:hypothetical protein
MSPLSSRWQNVAPAFHQIAASFSPFQCYDPRTRTGAPFVEYSRHFKFLICAPAFDPADLEGQRLQAIADEIERDGYGVMKARKVDDAELVIQTDAAVGCVLLNWGKRGPQGKMAGLVSSDFDSYRLKMGLKTALCRRKAWNWSFW